MIYYNHDVKKPLDSYRGLVLKNVMRICFGDREDLSWDESYLQLSFKGGRSLVLECDGSGEILCLHDEEWDGGIPYTNDPEDDINDERCGGYLIDVSEDAHYAPLIGERLTSIKYYKNNVQLSDNLCIIGAKLIFETKCIRFIVHWEYTFIVVDNIQRTFCLGMEME